MSSRLASRRRSTRTAKVSSGWLLWCCSLSCVLRSPGSCDPARRSIANRLQAKSGDRLSEASEGKRTHRIGLGHVDDIALGLRVEDDLAGARRAAQARREVRHVADRRVFPARLEA